MDAFMSCNAQDIPTPSRCINTLPTIFGDSPTQIMSARLAYFSAHYRSRPYVLFLDPLSLPEYAVDSIIAKLAFRSSALSRNSDIAYKVSK